MSNTKWSFEDQDEWSQFPNVIIYNHQLILTLNLCKL